MYADLTTLIRLPQNVPSAQKLSQYPGLSLTEGELILLMQHYELSLRAFDRISLEPEGIETILTAFADSPWLPATDQISTFAELTDLFHSMKNRTDDLTHDEALLRRMREHFDDCHGCAELLADRMEGIFQNVRDE